MMLRLPLLFLALCLAPAAAWPAPDVRAVRFNLNFEGASLGKVEAVSENRYRCAIAGQHDERGRNRQASWYYFRLDHVAGRDLTITLTETVGEYNDRPGAVALSPHDRPVYSYNQRDWHYLPGVEWNDEKKEATLRLKPEHDTVWIAHQAPYVWSDLLRLLEEVDRSPLSVVEVIGRSVQGRELHLVTVTNPGVPDADKKVVWLQARQHAWETGTSYTMEGALRWVISDDPAARALRDRIVFKFTPLLDPDGCVSGGVRFNANGYDLNRHWSTVDLRTKEYLRLMPEIWYAKKAILAQHARQPLALMLNLHNTQTEYMDTRATDTISQELFHRLFTNLNHRSLFDPTRPLGLRPEPSADTNALYHEAGVPVALLELRTLKSPKLGRPVEHHDRRKFGAELIRVMAETVLEKPGQ